MQIIVLLQYLLLIVIRFMPLLVNDILKTFKFFAVEFGLGGKRGAGVPGCGKRGVRLFSRKYEFSSLQWEAKILLTYIAININSASQPTCRWFSFGASILFFTATCFFYFWKRNNECVNSLLCLGNIFFPETNPTRIWCEPLDYGCVLAQVLITEFHFYFKNQVQEEN